jgi:hypothetical protein
MAALSMSSRLEAGASDLECNEGSTDKLARLEGSGRGELKVKVKVKRRSNVHYYLCAAEGTTEP